MNTSPLKILVIGNYSNYISARPEAETLIGLKKAGIDLTIISVPGTEYAIRFRAAGIRYLDAYPRKKFDIRFISFVRSELKRGKYDLLQLFSNNSIYNGLIAAIGIRVKVIIYRGYTGNIHWYDPSCYLKHLSPRVDKIICLSESVREMFLRQLFFPKHKAITINKGHDPEWYSSVKPSDYREFNLPPGIFKAVCVANARPMKGIRYLIRAIDQLPADLAICFFLIGNDMEKGIMGRMIKKNRNKNKIYLTGFRRDVLEMVAGADLFILPSIKGEATTKALIEAMSLGVPSLVTDIPGNRELALDGITSLKVPPKDPKALTDGIEKLYHDDMLRRQLGKQSKEHVQQNFHIRDTIRKIAEMYQKLIEQRQKL